MTYLIEGTHHECKTVIEKMAYETFFRESLKWYDHLKEWGWEYHGRVHREALRALYKEIFDSLELEYFLDLLPEIKRISHEIMQQAIEVVDGGGMISSRTQHPEMGESSI